MIEDYTNCLWANPYSICACSCDGQYHGVLQASAIFPVTGCANCQHPGSLHVIKEWEPRITACRVCDCREWVKGLRVDWSTEQTWRAIPEWGEDRTVFRRGWPWPVPDDPA